ncbi:30S ribosomal protein S16 [Buchnera aphidicola (Hyadaphis tataricae)]|uniref:Small ribosomal subunit protein bS16 n=1 Tax=Buchnera aphidicola (Hyadaphis tataricae) TaxID=1241859 RepID=A0A4D6YB50_9GAMM|nr:30S ribosomal protein S16 [Buchnera aphidicola]QCI21685.1 30S ribosomal protein S16 [Buchnera aphidicola (Hyadaphis tataricae)]
MVKIRLARYGAKKRPFYKMVVADSRCSRDGKFIENVGYFNPIAKGKSEKIKLNLDRITYWKKQGAQMSARIKKIVQLSDKKEVEI